MAKTSTDFLIKTESRFIQGIKLLAHKYNVSIKINYETHEVNFSTPKEIEAEFAIELDELYRDIFT